MSLKHTVPKSTCTGTRLYLYVFFVIHNFKTPYFRANWFMKPLEIIQLWISSALTILVLSDWFKTSGLVDSMIQPLLWVNYTLVYMEIHACSIYKQVSFSCSDVKSCVWKKIQCYISCTPPPPSLLWECTTLWGPTARLAPHAPSQFYATRILQFGVYQTTAPP